MALGADILKLLVEADTKGAINEFKKLEGSAGSSLAGVEKQSASFGQRFSGSLSTLGSSMASALGPAAIASTVGAGVGIAINAASNLNEQVSKTRSVFGESAGEIEKWAGTAATSLGQSKTQALEAASSFGNMFLQLGIARGAAVDMSTAMTGLASDFASFFNASPQEALEAISSAFRGEFDAVQRFVPTITAATVEQEALKEGLAKTKGELTAGDKAIATYNILLRDAGQASGDFGRTSDSLANQQRIMKANFENSAASIGNFFLPALAKAAKGVNDFIVTFQQSNDQFGVGKGDTPGGGGLIGFLTGGKVNFQAPSLGDFWTRLTKGADEADKKLREQAEAERQAGKDAEWAATHVGSLASSADMVTGALGPAGNAVGDFARNTIEHFTTAATSTDLLKTNVSGLGREIGPAGAAFGELGRQTGSVVTSMDMVPSSADALANSIARQGSEAADAAKKDQDYADAIDQVHDAIDQLNGLQLDSAELQQRVVEATQNAIDVAKDQKATSLEKTVAFNDEVKAAKSAAENQRAIAIETSKATTEAGKAAEGQNAYIAALTFMSNNVTPEAKAQILGLIGAYQTFGAQDPATPPIDLDTDPFNTKAADAQRKIDELDKQRPKPVTDADTAPFNAKAVDTQRKIDELDKKRPKPVADADNTSADTKIETSKAKADELDRKRPKPVADLQDNASSKVDTVTSKVNAFAGLSASATVSVNVGTAATNINRIIDGLNVINQAPGGSSIRYGRIASGTRNWRGGFAMVGELGPELVYLPKGAQVKTAAETNRIMNRPFTSVPQVPGPGRHGTGNVVVNITVNGAVDPFNTARQIQRILAQGSRGGFSTLAA